MRISIVAVGAVATTMALTVHSIYGLWYLSSDLVYVILFPQLVCVVYYKEHTNTYGSLAAYIVGLSLRGLGGEPIIGLPPFIKYPFYDADRGGQLFPFRTFAMLSSAFTIVYVSRLTIYIFEKGVVAPEWDIFGCVVNVPDDVIVVQDPHEELSVLNTSVAKSYQSSEFNGRVNPDFKDDDNGNASSHENKVRDCDTQHGNAKSNVSSSSYPMAGLAPGKPPPLVGSLPNQSSPSPSAGQRGPGATAAVAASVAAAAGRGLVAHLRRPSEVAYVATQL